MKSKFGFLILLALAFQAQAVSVSPYQARFVAQAWTGSGSVLNTAVQPEVSDVKTYAITNGLVLHAVTMADGRTVFVSGDQALEPVVALASGTLSEDSPLIDILKQDAFLRAVAAGYFKPPSGITPSTTKPAFTTASAATPETVQTPEMARKWAALLPKTQIRTASSGQVAFTAADNAVDERDAADVITDMRVEPFLETRWSQTTAGGDPCYNYYTPNNYPCGCTATAISQAMRYFRYPEIIPWEANSTNGFDCLVDGATEKLFPVGISFRWEAADNWGVSGGPKRYDWDLMDADPARTTSDDVHEAIGHLTYEVAIALRSSFSAGSTGAYVYNAAGVFRRFGYPSAYVFSKASGAGYDDYQRTGTINEDETVNGLTGNAELRQKTILASLDAKLPVVLGLYGYTKNNGVKVGQMNGHAVVADGYGMAEIDGETTTYVHVNLGWGGTDDAWYNLPVIDTAEAGATMGVTSGSAFELLTDATFNVTSDENAAGKELVTGRILDEDGLPVADATVEASTNGIAVATATSDAHGIYALWVAGGFQYDIEAEVLTDEGSLISGSLDDAVRVTKTKTNTGLTPLDEAAVGRVSEASAVGNLWGQDVTVSSPCVRIGNVSYPNLERALEAAVDGDVVEIVLPARLKRSVVLDKSITIVSTNADAYATPVTCRNGASITVPDGTTVAFTNIVFNSEGTVVNVLEGGTADVSGVAVFGDLFSDVPGIRTAVATGFNLSGELLNGILLDCAAATDAGDAFGTYSCGMDAAAASANRIISLAGDDRAGSVLPDGTLVWQDDSVVSPEVARLSLVIDGAEPRYYRSLDKLFSESATSNGTITATLLRNSASLTNAWTLSGAADWTLHSTVPDKGTVNFKGSNPVEVNLTVGSSATLTVSHIVLAGTGEQTYQVSPLVVSTGAALTFDDGAEMISFHVGSKWHVVEVNGNAAFTMNSGSIFDCSVVGAGAKGTVYLANGATFDFLGGEIARCAAKSYGGAVYAERGSTLRIAGNASASDNPGSGKPGKPDNIYLAAGANLVLADGLYGSTGIGIGGKMISSGTVFCTVADGVSESATVASCVRMSNDSKPSLYASPSADGTKLVWSSVRPAPVPVPEGDAVASVTSGGETRYYDSLSEAFRAATADGSVVALTRDLTIGDGNPWDDSVKVLANDIVFDGRGHRLERPDDPNVKTDGYAQFAVTNFSLTVTNVTIAGGLGRVFDVYLGDLTLDSGAVITNLTGFTGEEHNITACTKDFVAPVVVYGGCFTMNPGSVITSCKNTFYKRESGGALAAGAVAVSGADTAPAVACLNGGEVSGCVCYSDLGAGGIYIGNGATVEVKGDFTVFDNAVVTNLFVVTNVFEEGLFPCNLVVHDLSALTLVGEFTGNVGFTEGVNANTNVFGEVDSEFSGDVQASAHNFTHDTDGDMGQAVTDGTKTLLVWSAALDENGQYTDGEGNVYSLVEGGSSVVPVPVPREIVYDGKAQTGIPAGPWYDITGNVATDAGVYEATLVLRPGYTWEDGGDATRTVTWEIKKADYVIGFIRFEDEKHLYTEGTNWVHKGITSTLPDGLSVSYANRSRSEVGTNTVIAAIAGGVIDPNYNIFTTNVTALLVVMPRKAQFPEAAELVYNGKEQTGVPAGQGYDIIGNVGTDARAYTAVLTLREGYVWSDGEAARTRNIQWRIGKADYLLYGVILPDEEYTYDGQAHTHTGITGNLPLPDWLNVRYDNDTRTDVGTNNVVATIYGGGHPNYNDYSSTREGKLIIVEPEMTIVTNTPSAIAFQSITRLSETEWELVITNLTPNCEYRLLGTDDLLAGFPDDVEWFRAAEDAEGAWATNVVTDAAAMFWKAEARGTETTNTTTSASN